MKVLQAQISELRLDEANARKHDTKNLKAIAASLEKFGQRKPIVVHHGKVIAGNGTLEAAKMLGWSEITITEVPENWDEDTAKAYAIADNRTAELADWNEEVLVKQLLDLEENGWDIKDFAFDDLILEDDKLESDSPYQDAINVPQYQVVGEQPEIKELYKTDKYQELLSQISKANLPDDVKTFLELAASRHIVFNYKHIAEYYPHVSAEIQQLMEASALVIIDAENAIKNGYADFMKTLDELRWEDDDE